MSRDLSIQKNTLEPTSLCNKDTEAYQSHVSPLKDNCNTTLIVENYALVTRNARNIKTFIVLLLLTSSKYIYCFRFESTLEL